MTEPGTRHGRSHHPVQNPASADGSFLDLVNLERIDRDIFRARFVFDEPYALYGGQVATQALLAAALTVGAERLPHSLHGYFLRPGDASRPTVFQVFRDRDGRSYSARRVVALQGGNVIFNMSTSFAIGSDSPDIQGETALDRTELPLGEEFAMPRLFSFQARTAPGDDGDDGFPLRWWARCSDDFALAQAAGAPIPRALLDILALTYLSDIGSGIIAYDSEEFQSGSSLDHVLWFHRPIAVDDWVLMDLRPRSVSYGRGLYHGDVLDAKGVLGASIAQQNLFRRVRR